MKAIINPNTHQEKQQSRSKNEFKTRSVGSNRQWIRSFNPESDQFHTQVTEKQSGIMRLGYMNGLSGKRSRLGQLHIPAALIDENNTAETDQSETVKNGQWSG